VLVHRRAVDIARREARRLEDSDNATVVDSASYTAEEMLILRLDRRQVHEAVKKLPARQREVLELTYYGGFSQSQLAARLGVPLGTIKSRIHTGIGLLAANLAT
jgi:RNA polymerase sigma-70 factor (ECF subfamily)